MTYVPFPTFAEWTVDFDPAIVDSYAERLQRAQESSTPEDLRRAVEIATRYAAVDTGAIEGLYETDRGFTRTIATQTEYWERALDMRGDRVKRSIQDALDAYEFVLDATTQNRPITANWLRQLHETITKHQETYTVWEPAADGGYRESQRLLPHGEYKEYPNNPTSRTTGRAHDYATPEETSSEVLRLMDELATPAFTAAHPIVQAAYAHYGYVCIHPFADGNGRVARALASVYLYRNPGVPLVIFADQRNPYLDALEAADDGRRNPFVHFIAERVIDTVMMVIESITHSRAEVDESSVIASINEATSNWLSDDLVLAAQRLQNGCVAALDAVIAAKNLPALLDVSVIPALGIGYEPPNLPPGYVLAGQNPWITVMARIDQTPDHRYGLVHVIAGTTQQDKPELMVVPCDEDGVSLEVWKRDIEPMELTCLRMRIDAWADNVAHSFINRLSGILTQDVSR